MFSKRLAGSRLNDGVGVNPDSDTVFLMIRVSVLSLALGFTLILNACSNEKLSREGEIEFTIAAAIEAAENRSASDLSELVDKSYLDEKTLNKTQLIKLVRLYFFRHKNIYLLSKLGAIEFPAENEALVTLHVAMAGSAISDITALSSLRASMHRFDLELIKDHKWLLRSATWHPASIRDMN